MNNKLTEPEIYCRCKEILVKNKWTLLGGEPPDGTDNIPRIQLKDNTYKKIGSKGSKKIDLVAAKGDKILLLELKGKYNSSDIEKLNEITSENRWINALSNALLDKKAFKLANIDSIPIIRESLIKAIGIPEKHGVPSDFILLQVEKETYQIYIGELSGIDEKFFHS